MGLFSRGNFETETEPEQIEAEPAEGTYTEVAETDDVTGDGKLESSENFSERNKDFRNSYKVDIANSEVGDDGKLETGSSDDGDGGRERSRPNDDGGRG